MAGPQPLVLEGTVLTTAAAVTHPDTMIWFPLSWRACLIGSPRRFDQGTDKAHPQAYLAFARIVLAARGQLYSFAVQGRNARHVRK